MVDFKKFVVLCFPILILMGAAFFALKHIAEAWSAWVALPSLVGVTVYAIVIVDIDCHMFRDMAKDPTVAPFVFMLAALLVGLLVWGIVSLAGG